MKKTNKIKFKYLIIIFLVSVIKTQNVSSDYIIKGVENIFDNGDTRNILFSGIILSVIANKYDYLLQNRNQSKKLMSNNLAKLGDYWGKTNQFIIWSTLSGNYRDEQLNYSMNSFIANGIITYGIKFSTMRRRPDLSNKRSFPSGHTSNSFLGATILQNVYGSEVGIPGYILASITGMSRINDNKHYLSDVIFGAALGVAIGTGFNYLYKEEIHVKNKTFKKKSFKINFSWSF